MTTDEKMKKNSSGLLKKPTASSVTLPGRIDQLFIDLTNKRSVHEVSRGGFSLKKNIEAV